MCSMPSRDRQPLERLVRWLIVSKVDSIGLLVRSNRSNDDVIDADHHQRAQFRLLHPQAAVDAIGPDIYTAVFVEALLVPGAILIRPDLLQTGYGAR